MNLLSLRSSCAIDFVQSREMHMGSTLETRTAEPCAGTAAQKSADWARTNLRRCSERYDMYTVHCAHETHASASQSALRLEWRGHGRHAVNSVGRWRAAGVQTGARVVG